MYPAALRPLTKRAPWTPEEHATLLNMRNEGCSSSMLPFLTGVKGRSRCATLQSSKSSVAESDGVNRPIPQFSHDSKLLASASIDKTVRVLGYRYRLAAADALGPYQRSRSSTF